MRIDAISIGNNPPEDINVIIEVAIGGEPIKYEMDKEAGTLVVDRFLHTPMRYPGNYGFVPHTLSDDGDPIDVLVANTRPIIPGALINVRPIGVLRMTDNAGGDEKIIAVPSPHLTKRYMNVHNYTDLPQITLEQIQHFFEHYKDLEPGKWVKLAGWGDAEEARKLIVEAIEQKSASSQKASAQKEHVWRTARSGAKAAPVTPDGRYLVVRGRLWRRANPGLAPEERANLVAELMSARRAKRSAIGSNDAGAREAARQRVDAAKTALGERGPVWWTDGAPDFNRHMARNTPYAAWFAAITDGVPSG